MIYAHACVVAGNGDTGLSNTNNHLKLYITPRIGQHY